MLNIIKEVAKEIRSQVEEHVLTDDTEGRYGNSKEFVQAVGATYTLLKLWIC
jgi:predicted phosphoadenosine phosphosulfate sulfurtransferase